MLVYAHQIPGGELIDTFDFDAALTRTRDALKQKTIPIFESAFVASDVLVRVDLLVPDINDYRRVEVKSATEVKDYHYEDAAAQDWVLCNADLLKYCEQDTLAMVHIAKRFCTDEIG